MEELLKTLAASIVTVLVLIFATVGGFMLVNATDDYSVIHNCKTQGWHNFDQTRIICSVEPKKEAK